MSRFNHAIDFAFEFVCEEEDDPIVLPNLPGILAAARARLDRIEAAADLQPFDTFDVYTVEEGLSEEGLEA